MQNVNPLPELSNYDIEKEKKKTVHALRKMMESCITCGQCLENCVFYDFSKKQARNIMGEIKEFVFSKNFSKKLSRKAKTYIWSCGICEHCLNSCSLPRDQQFSRSVWISMLRAILVRKGEAPLLVKLAGILFRDKDTPILKYLWPLVAKINVPEWYSDANPLYPKIRIAIEKGRKFPEKGAEICFFGGCGHTWAIPDVVYQMISVLEQAGVDYITIGNPEFCCGVMFILLGFLDVWLDQTYRVMQNYLKMKPRPKKLLLHCPGCTTIHMFDMAKYGITLPLDYLRKMPNGIEMEHVSEYTLSLIKEGKIKPTESVPLTVTYNDNCSIGRRVKFMGHSIYEEPREMLKSIPGLNLVESDYNRDNAFCCGGVASLPLTFGAKSHVGRVHYKLFKNMLDKGSDTLLTPCNGCVLTFRTGAKRLQKKLGHRIKVLDLMNIVNLSLGNEIPIRSGLAEFSLGKTLRRFIKTQAYRDLYRLIKETIIYLLFPKKYNPKKYD